MKFWALAFGIAGIAGALSPQNEPSWTVVVGGDTDGYLSPCGCTKPMIGGIKRRATAIRHLGHERTVILETGGLGGSSGRQSEMKAETAAQVAAASDTTALHFTERDAELGRGSAMSVLRLAEGRVVSTSVEEPAVEGLKPWIAKGPFLIGGISPRSESLRSALGGKGLAAEDAANRLVTAAKQRKRTPIAMYSGDLSGARALARSVPALGLIVYRSAGDPPPSLQREGSTVLLTPGEKGKHLLRVQFDGKTWRAYAALRLGPEYKDDPTTDRLFRTYLRRVEHANLLDRWPRGPGEAFAGTEACGKCHAEAYAVWKKSGHAHALATLEGEGQGRDPDCVSCHVVGLSLSTGFRSREDTPNLADVGCESCHGPGAAHSAAPEKFPFARVGASACTSCHRPEQSPNFSFDPYWKRIQH
jgi:hypothetical protein